MCWQLGVEISEASPASEPGIRTVHEIRLNGEYVGFVDVGYLRKEDVKTFQRSAKRKLSVGQPFGVQLFIDASKSGVTAKQIGLAGLQEIVRAVKTKFVGLEDKDLYVLEVVAGNKKPVGRGEALTIT